MTKRDTIVDSNVLVVANHGTPEAPPCCVRRAIRCLQRIREECCIRLDDKYNILREYRKQFDERSLQGVGFQFFIWVHDNQANTKHCRRVVVTPDEERVFEEFPDDNDLAGFDRDDRVFVAVALGGVERVPIVNAADRDWWEYRSAFERHGIEIEFLCPDLMSSR